MQMGDVYASAIGTTTLQLKGLPKRPQHLDGVIFVYTRPALRWQRLGNTKPSGSTELEDCARLATALQQRSEFTMSEWAAFEIDELKDNAVVESGGMYYKPAPVDEATLRAEFAAFGEIVSIEMGEAPVTIRFSTHEAARSAARAAAKLTHIAGDVGTMWNARSYDGRVGEVGLDDDEGRGW